ncbi:UDP-glycosyltransferase family 36 member A1 [Musca autumnalis]|uniref:UDP-glycosyltransferase family 36 member A1 n=1 Tax=Musca autumnalis TaxID=221902 RepID=UPI003CEEB529
MRCALITTAFCLLWFVPNESKQILSVFPHFGYSHFKVFYPLLRNLAEKGHSVTVITHIKTPDPPLATYEELLLEQVEVVNVVPLTEWIPRTWKGLFDEYVGLHVEGQESCERLYESGYIQEVLKRHEIKPYDIVITEYFNSDCQLVVPYLMKTPIVGLSSCLLMPWYYERILLPDTPSFVQSEFIGFATPLNWYERLTNFLQAKVLSLLYRYHTNRLDNELIHHHLNVSVDVNSIAKQQTAIVFGNQHYSLTGIRPHSEQFVEIGGIHIQENKVNEKLPSHVEKFLEMSKGDVLFISWGSMVRASTMEADKLNAILSALVKSKLKVIWKWETDEVPIKNDNFLFVKWAPQLSLLCHPKIKLFWGHGGLLGTTEAVYCGKPMILTPIYGDQFVNAFAAQNRKIGRILNFEDISENNLDIVLQEILQDVSYNNNAKGLSNIFRDRPNKPLETATWWVEHIMEHERARETLHSHAVDLNWFIYYSLDSICIVLASFIGPLLFLLYIIKCALRSSAKHTNKLKRQ